MTAKLDGMRAAGDRMERHAANTHASTLSIADGDQFLAGFYAELNRLAKEEERVAREQAKGDRHYVAREGGNRRWYVWDCVSDHRVEFN